MCQDNEALRTQHFTDNWLAWAALHHFLTAPLIRELSYVIVDRMSNGAINLTQLFDETVYGNPDSLAMWLIRPLETPSPLARYLQLRIRTFAWQSDLGFIANFTKEESTEHHGRINPSLLDKAVALGSADFESAVNILKDMEDTEQTSFTIIVNTFNWARESVMSSSTDEFITSLESKISSIDLPLDAVILKHFGDLCADIDAWEKAKALYEKTEQRLVNGIPSAWHDLCLSLRAIISQSRAAAIFTLDGAKPAADFLMGALEQSTTCNAPVLLENASFDAYVAAMKASSGLNLKLPRDHRSTLLLPPLFHKTHSIDIALNYWLAGKFSDANQQFWAVLRRQIALGSLIESRKSKFHYARSILDDIDQAKPIKNQLEAFSMALRLLVESGDRESAAKLPWSQKLVDTCVNSHCVDLTVAHAKAHSGSRLERQMVAIVLFREWCVRTNIDRTDVAISMLKYISTLALEPSSFYSGEDIGGLSLKALQYVGQKRPELRPYIMSEVATAVSEKLHTPGFWTGTQEALDTALSYVDVLPDDSLKKVIDSTLSLLDEIDPKAGVWVIVRPAIRLLISDPVRRFAKKTPDLESRIISLILRFGLGHESEYANVMFYLHEFDSALLREDSVQDRLKNVVTHLRQKATEINSSNVASNILALLYAPSVSGLDGVKDALKGMRLILESAKKPHPSIALSIAYDPLLLLADRKEQIAGDILMSAKKFVSLLKPLVPLVTDLWNVAIDQPLLFTSFSIPSATIPDSTLVHNWTVASLRFAKSLNKDQQIKEAIASAETQPLLRDAIKLGRATLSLAAEYDAGDTENIRTESREAFYSSLGRRLALLQKLDDEQARDLCTVLLDQCCRFGPQELDAAVFLSAIHLGISERNRYITLSDYRKKIDNNRILQLALLPILHIFENSVE